MTAVSGGVIPCHGSRERAASHLSFGQRPASIRRSLGKGGWRMRVGPARVRVDAEPLPPLDRETPHANLARAMQRLNGAYTRAFNRAHRRVGHVLQGRYKAIVVQKESYLVELCRYIHLNPVRSRLISTRIPGAAIGITWGDGRRRGCQRSLSCDTLGGGKKKLDHDIRPFWKRGRCAECANLGKR